MIGLDIANVLIRPLLLQKLRNLAIGMYAVIAESLLKTASIIIIIMMEKIMMI